LPTLYVPFAGVECEDVEQVNNSRPVDVADARYPDKYTVTCLSGFTLTGQAEVSCQTDGKWTSRPECVKSNGR